MLFSPQVVSHSLWSHGLQHAMPPCPPPSPGVCPSSCPLHRWCHPTISSSDALFSFCFQSFPASGSFPMCWLFALGAKVLELQLQYQPYQWIFRGWYIALWWWSSNLTSLSHHCARLHAKLLQSCLTLCDLWMVAHQAPLSMGILQARILEWAATHSSRGSSWPRDRARVS